MTNLEKQDNQECRFSCGEGGKKVIQGHLRNLNYIFKIFKIFKRITQGFARFMRSV